MRDIFGILEGHEFDEQYRQMVRLVKGVLKGRGYTLLARTSIAPVIKKLGGTVVDPDIVFIGTIDDGTKVRKIELAFQGNGDYLLFEWWKVVPRGIHKDSDVLGASGVVRITPDLKSIARIVSAKFIDGPWKERTDKAMYSLTKRPKSKKVKRSDRGDGSG